MVLVVAPDHPLACARFVGGEQLSGEHAILYDVSAADREAVRKLLFPQGGGFRPITRVPLTEAILEMVKAGMGVSILANWSVTP